MNLYTSPFGRHNKGWTQQFSVALEWDTGPYARNEEAEVGEWERIRR
jgi:hypothetical protein